MISARFPQFKIPLNIHLTLQTDIKKNENVRDKQRKVFFSNNLLYIGKSGSNIKKTKKYSGKVVFK